MADRRSWMSRREGEWQAGHIEQGAVVAVRSISEFPAAAGKNSPLAVHCKSGYRSTIACSLLLRAGYEHVSNSSAVSMPGTRRICRKPKRRP